MINTTKMAHSFRQSVRNIACSIVSKGVSKPSSCSAQLLKNGDPSLQKSTGYSGLYTKVDNEQALHSLKYDALKNSPRNYQPDLNLWINSGNAVPKSPYKFSNGDQHQPVTGTGLGRSILNVFGVQPSVKGMQAIRYNGNNATSTYVPDSKTDHDHPRSSRKAPRRPKRWSDKSAYLLLPAVIVGLFSILENFESLDTI